MHGESERLGGIIEDAVSLNRISLRVKQLLGRQVQGHVAQLESAASTQVLEKLRMTALRDVSCDNSVIFF